MSDTPVLVAWSGGKDCLMALDRLLADPDWNVTGLLCTLDRASDRVAMHGVRGDVLRAQVEALGLPLLEMAVDWPASNVHYESALSETLDRARRTTPGIEHIAFGDLFLRDLRNWREASLARIGWHPVFPLWNEPTRALADAFLARGHRAVVTTIDLDRLDERYCGRALDAAFLDDLPASVDACGENGEFHTLCHSSPLFARPLTLVGGRTVILSERFRCMDFVLA
jgi:uncharacterized protein (TIGR00290 family)